MTTFGIHVNSGWKKRAKEYVQKKEMPIVFHHKRFTPLGIELEDLVRKEIRGKRVSGAVIVQGAKRMVDWGRDGLGRMEIIELFLAERAKMSRLPLRLHKAYLLLLEFVFDCMVFKEKYSIDLQLTNEKVVADISQALHNAHDQAEVFECLRLCVQS